MIEEKRITSPKELEKYIGKLIVCHYNSWSTHSKSLRILERVHNTQNSPMLNGCKIYGKYILRFGRNGRMDSTFCCQECSLYASNVEYVTLPTTEEKHLFMEKYAPTKMRNDYNVCLKKSIQY